MYKFTSEYKFGNTYNSKTMYKFTPEYKFGNTYNSKTMYKFTPEYKFGNTYNSKTMYKFTPEFKFGNPYASETIDPTEPVSTIPGGTQGSTVPGGTQGPTIPGGTQGSTMPGGTQGSTVPGGTQGPTIPGGTQGSTVPGGTQGPTIPGGTQGSTIPGGTQGSTIPGGTQGPIIPGGTQDSTEPLPTTPEGTQNSTESPGVSKEDQDSLNHKDDKTTSTTTIVISTVISVVVVIAGVLSAALCYIYKKKRGNKQKDEFDDVVIANTPADNCVIEIEGEDRPNVPYPDEQDSCVVKVAKEEMLVEEDRAFPYPEEEMQTVGDGNPLSLDKEAPPPVSNSGRRVAQKFVVNYFTVTFDTPILNSVEGKRLLLLAHKNFGIEGFDKMLELGSKLDLFTIIKKLSDQTVNALLKRHLGPSAPSAPVSALDNTGRLSALLTKYQIGVSPEEALSRGYYKEIVLKLHPDKGGNAEDFAFYSSLLNKEDSSKTVSSYNTAHTLYKLFIGFNIADAGVNAIKSYYDPTVQNMATIVVNGAVLLDSYSGFGVTKAIIPILSCGYTYYEFGLQEAFKSMAMSSAIILAPTLITLPYIGTACAVGLASYSMINFVNDVVSLYTVISSNAQDVEEVTEIVSDSHNKVLISEDMQLVALSLELNGNRTL